MLEQAPSSSSKVPLIFLNLIGYSEAEGQDDLTELFGRAQHAFRSRKLSRTEFKLRWLLNRWVRMLRLDATEWRSTILLRGLFVESLGWGQLAHLLKLSEARIRSLSLDALLEEVSPEDFLSRPTRGCARNDLYLLDVLTRQAWSDRMGIYPQSHFERHLAECDRCFRVFEKTQRYQLDLRNSRLMKIPTQLEWKGQTELEASPPPMWMSRFGLPMKAVGTLAVAVLIFLGVVSTPYLGRYLKVSKESAKVATLDEKPDIADIEEAMPLESVPMEPAPRLPELAAQLPPPAATPEAPRVAVKPLPLKPAPKPVEVAVKKTAANGAIGTSNIFFRWGARAEDPDRVTQKVLGLLSELNAKNAGELEFGALYRGGRYFHFMVSKAEYANLLSNIKTLPLTDFTDSAADSDRVIPGDQSRIVFWIGPSGR